MRKNAYSLVAIIFTLLLAHLFWSSLDDPNDPAAAGIVMVDRNTTENLAKARPPSNSIVMPDAVANTATATNDAVSKTFPTGTPHGRLRYGSPETFKSSQ